MRGRRRGWAGGGGGGGEEGEFNSLGNCGRA